MDPIVEVYALVAWLAALKGFQLALYPLLKGVFGKSAYPVAYPAGFLIFGILSWYAGFFGGSVALALIPMGLLLSWGVLTRRCTWSEVRSNLLYDAIFLLGFMFVLETRFVNPVITYFSEGYMDHAFIASVMRSPVVPPADPWFAPHSITMYYYYGHWLMGATGSVIGIRSSVAYNLAVPTAFGMSFVTLYAIGKLYTTRSAWLAIAAVFVIPLAVFIQALENGAYGLYMVLDIARHIIPGTLVDYPLFSMWIGDAHANLLGVFNQVFLIFLLSFTLLHWPGLPARGKWCLAGLTGLSLGAVMVIHTWDVVIYGPLTAVVGLCLWHDACTTEPRSLYPALFFPGAPIVAYLAYLPYHLSFRVEGLNGIGLTSYHTPILSFLQVAGIFVIFFIALLFHRIRKKPWLLISTVPFLVSGLLSAALALVPLVYLLNLRKKEMPCILAMAGLAILLFVEIFHFREALTGENERYNTVVKMYFSALLILALSVALVIGKWWDRRPPRITPKTARVLAVVLAALLLITPFVLQMDIGKGLLGISYPQGYYSLDGLSYLDSVSPGDAAAIRFLQSRSGNDTIVEAFGGDYSYYSRVSSFTGIPTILGQMNAHEFSWRGDRDGWYWYRPLEIAAIYEEPNHTVRLMDKYGANLLYVGDAERDLYQVQLPEKGLVRIYRDLGVEIYERTGIPGQSGGYRILTPTLIEVPGYYEIDRDIPVRGDGPGIFIHSSDVVIEGNGHLISRVDEDGDSATGIVIYRDSSQAKNITVRNTGIRGFDTGIIGVNAAGLVLDGVVLASNREGISLSSCDSIRIRNAVITGSETAIILEGTGNSVILQSRLEKNEAGLVLRDAVNNQVCQTTFDNRIDVIEEGQVSTVWNMTRDSPSEEPCLASRIQGVWRSPPCTFSLPRTSAG